MHKKHSTRAACQRSQISCAVAAILGGASLGAHAQVPPAGNTGAAAPEPGSEALAEVTVTAQRRTERMQDVPIGPDEQPAATTAALHVAELKASECANPCRTLPYRVRSAAEQDVVNAYQAIAKAAGVLR